MAGNICQKHWSSREGAPTEMFQNLKLKVDQPHLQCKLPSPLPPGPLTQWHYMSTLPCPSSVHQVLVECHGCSLFMVSSLVPAVGNLTLNIDCQPTGTRGEGTWKIWKGGVGPIKIFNDGETSASREVYQWIIELFSSNFWLVEKGRRLWQEVQKETEIFSMNLSCLIFLIWIWTGKQQEIFWSGSEFLPV